MGRHKVTDRRRISDWKSANPEKVKEQKKRWYDKRRTPNKTAYPEAYPKSVPLNNAAYPEKIERTPNVTAAYPENTQAYPEKAERTPNIESTHRVTYPPPIPESSEYSAVVLRLVSLLDRGYEEKLLRSKSFEPEDVDLAVKLFRKPR